MKDKDSCPFGANTDDEIKHNDVCFQNKDKTSSGINLRIIGTVSSMINDPSQVRHLHRGWTEDVAQICLDSKYKRGLSGLSGYSHIIVLFWVNRKWKMPKNNNRPKDVKVFATRMPIRPNRIGMSVVKLLDFSPFTGILTIKGIDAVDGTPVLDIKPYIPNFDSYPEATVPEWVKHHLDDHHHHPNEHTHEHL
ncbi:tRNA (N6-threonylcarbamoyladenosine(37)-N6)-methyltransferase TrmO [bacterium]|nr:tRNA (N6-threonylcarbamoyladenosine(37)-N6)-methyltransferase TrmO [bacterium]